MVLTCKVGTNLKNIILNFNNCNTSLNYLSAFETQKILIKVGKKNLVGKKGRGRETWQEKNDGKMKPGGNGKFFLAVYFFAGKMECPPWEHVEVYRRGSACT